MFERFTPRARRVIVLAQDAAREMGHPHIRPEHLLAALALGEGMAANAMAQSGVDLASLRRKVAERTGSRASARKVDRVPFSTEGKKALELSLRAALGLGHNYIGTEHLFFGVEREAEARGQTLDDLLGVPGAQVHRRLVAMLGDSIGRRTRSPALESAMQAARLSAGQAPVTTGDLLRAMVADGNSQAARALAGLGVAGDALNGALVAVPLADTSDAMAAPEAVSLTIGDTTTIVADADVARALGGLDADQLRDLIRRAAGLAPPSEATG